MVGKTIAKKFPESFSDPDFNLQMGNGQYERFLLQMETRVTNEGGPKKKSINIKKGELNNLKIMV